MTPSTPHLQLPPRLDRLPVAMLHALKLRGAIVQCGPGHRGVAWPDSPRVRLATLAPFLNRHTTASHLTAAWVWGAAKTPGTQLSFTTHSGRRSPVDGPRHVRWHQFQLQPGHLVRLGGHDVTMPERTVFDLLHHPGRFETTEIVACRLLLMHPSVSRAELWREIFHERRPHCALARRRLRHITQAPG